MLIQPKEDDWASRSWPRTPAALVEALVTLGRQLDHFYAERDAESAGQIKVPTLLREGREMEIASIEHALSRVVEAAPWGILDSIKTRRNDYAMHYAVHAIAETVFKPFKKSAGSKDGFRRLVDAPSPELQTALDSIVARFEGLFVKAPLKDALKREDVLSVLYEAGNTVGSGPVAAARKAVGHAAGWKPSTVRDATKRVIAQRSPSTRQGLDPRTSSPSKTTKKRRATFAANRKRKP